MAQYTAAYTSYLSRSAEIDILRKHASRIERAQPIDLAADVNALCRSAIVLLSSHLEAFIKELGEIALDAMHTRGIDRNGIPSRLYYHISKDIIDKFSASDPDVIAEKVFQFLATDQDYWSKVGPFPRAVEISRFNKGFSNPKHEKIERYFKRFGYSGYIHDMKVFLTRDYQTITNMVDHIVDTRNMIAHGDLSATKTPSEIAQMSAMARTYCQATDKVFATWWKSKFCSIR